MGQAVRHLRTAGVNLEYFPNLQEDYHMADILRKKAIWAWTMYDWGNSAFATTVMAAILPNGLNQSKAVLTIPTETVRPCALVRWAIPFRHST